MSYHLFSEVLRKAKKAHRCIWCGEAIESGESYIDERSVFERQLQRRRWHTECIDAVRKEWRAGADEEFIAYSNERGCAEGPG